MSRTHGPDPSARRRLLAALTGLAGLAARPAGFAGAGLCLSGLAAAAHAAAPGSGLCGQAPAPPYPPDDRPPLVHCWLAGGRQDGPPPDCTGLTRTDPELLLRVVGSFAAPGELAAQLLRLGAVSTHQGMRYWSFTERKRITLIEEAYAVESQAPGQAPTQRRADFSLEELRRGEPLVYLQRDNRSSALVPYGLRVLASGPDAVRARVENLGDLKTLGMTLVAARELQWLVAIERLGGGRWGWRSLLALQRLRLGSADKHRLSNLARAVALFDWFAGRQTEIEAWR